jgi:phosphoribosyl-AMP cyclohydrolase
MNSDTGNGERSAVDRVVDFEKLGGMVPVIAQDHETGEVLMMAYMNREAFAETLRTGRVCYFSRSRNSLWRKGEESGNAQEVHGVYLDCDADALLVKVRQIGGAACHEGYRSCFFRRVADDELQVVAERVFDPADVYARKS